ncbi:MAG: penicillin-binding protein activator LpoB [Treponema sp.]|nr:penicillin-binding protein activator LpoB [Treponema sp.]
MKKTFISWIAMIVLVTLFGACVSLEDRELTMQERSQVEVLSSVTVSFPSFQFFNITNERSIKNKAYAELRRAAQRQFSGDIDIKNITIAGSGSGWEALYIVVPTLIAGGLAYGYGEMDSALFTTGIAAGGAAAATLIFGNFQKITATGDVVMLNTRARASEVDLERLERVLDISAASLVESIPQNATIAILNIFSSDNIASEYVVDEIEFRLIRTRKFHVVDRRRLEQIRREQNFQMSGDVNDRSAVSIGNMLGASIVITGEISGNRLMLRALDVQTARVIAMSREVF